MKQLIWLLSMTFLLVSKGFSQGINLIKEGKSDYKIYVGAKASQPEKYAATELQKYLEEVSGCLLPITSSAGGKGKLIYVGFQDAPKSVVKNLDPKTFGKEEFIIRSDGKNLLIAGGAPRGTLYGVLGYLTDYLGCRWYTREYVKIPKQSTVTLPQKDDRQKPAFEYREAWYREAYDTKWALHNRLNPNLPDSLGGSFVMFPFVHTFDLLVPPAEYFEKHPEYYAEVAGKRQKTQLCLTNPAVVKLAKAKVFQWIKEHPEASVYSIDQNDGDGYCECVNCKKLDDEQESHSGSLLTFVNQIADTVAKVYPAVKLQTLAYAYTEIPPKTIRPAANVTIRLCHGNYCSAHSIEGCDNHKQYRERLQKWKTIASQITIWDYFTSFSQYLIPFPNFEALKHDVKFYADNGVVGLFAQGSNVPNNGGGEFSELRSWVFAQLMWNPHRDAQVLIDEFVSNVYGDASKYIGEYIKMMHNEVKPDSVYFSIWVQPTEVSYLNLRTITKADSLFTLAKKAAAKDPALAERVELAYLPILYSKLYFYTVGGTSYLSTKDMPEALKRFNAVIEKHQITQTSEELGNLDKLRKLLAVLSSYKFYTDWSVIGPFDNSDAKALSTVFAPEKEFSANKTYNGKNGVSIKWQPAGESSGYIDFNKLFTPNENVVSYAYKTVTLSESKTMKFGVGSNDGVRVWVNGKLVLDRQLSRKAEPNEDTISVPMQKGENTILVKVDQLKKGWGFYFAELE